MATITLPLDEWAQLKHDLRQLQAAAPLPFTPDECDTYHDKSTGIMWQHTGRSWIVISDHNRVDL